MSKTTQPTGTTDERPDSEPASGSSDDSAVCPTDAATLLGCIQHFCIIYYRNHEPDPQPRFEIEGIMATAAIALQLLVGDGECGATDEQMDAWVKYLYREFFVESSP